MDDEVNFLGDIGERRPHTKNTSIGKMRSASDLESLDWVFLTVSVINIAATVALTIYRLVTVVQKDELSSPDFTLSIVLLLNAGFCLFYVLHGILREREFELYAFIAAVIVILAYCIIEYSVNAGKRTTIKLVRMVVGCVLAPLNVILAALVARKFGWLEFRMVGASEALQYMFRETKRFTSLLKFDLQIAWSLAILALKNGTKIDLLEQITIGVGIPYCLLWCIMGWQVMRKENKYLSIFFLVLGLPEIAYIIYKFIQIYRDDNDTDMLLEYAIMAAGAMALLVRMIVFIELYKVARNYGKGLKPLVFNSGSPSETSG